jgi:hypothetical protein
VTVGTWQTVGPQPLSVPARPASGLWTRVIDYVCAPLILRIAASGEWKPVADLPPCGADGFHAWYFGRDWLAAKNAPLGALIGKIGGSNNAIDDAAIFLVGSYAVITLEKQTGPLYLTINDAPEFLSDNTGELKVRIE